MKSHVVAVPNSINDAFSAVDLLGQMRLLRGLTCELLKLLYIWGWNDGFVSLRAEETRLASGLEGEDVGRALAELERLNFVRVRGGGDGLASVEILSLAAPVTAGSVDLGWWRYYQVSLSDDNGGCG